MKNLIEDPNALRILESLHDGVIVISKERNIVFINARARGLLGYEAGEVLDHRCKSITRTTECETGCPLTRAMEQNRDQCGLNMWYRAKDGRRVYCRTNVVLLRDDSGEVIGGVEIFSDAGRVLPLNPPEVEAFGFGNMIGRNPAMAEVFNLIRMVAVTDSTVLITGESGTGKELVAEAIHANSVRSGRPLVKVNFAALNEGVIESELFGHVKGAFTGATSDKAGRFELAHQGTLFLDEIGEAPLTTQVKLLRVLQAGEFEKVGSSRTVKVDVRLIAATNRDLQEAIGKGAFRQDLYYRLNVFRIPLPPLRERSEDIPLLADHFLKKCAAKMASKKIEGIEAEAMTRLMNYRFPGNIRELENIIEHAAIRCQGGVIRASDLPLAGDGALPVQPVKLHQIRAPLQSLERDLILRALDETKWRIAESAKILGLSRITLWRRMKEYDIRRLAASPQSRD